LPLLLTPLEKDLIDTHMPIAEKEKEAWRAFVGKMDSEGKRVEIVRVLHRVLEAGEEESKDISKSDYGQAFQGLIHKPDVMERIETLHTLASLPKEIRVKGSEAREIVASDRHVEKLQNVLQELVGRIIPVKEFHPEGRAALKNVEYLGNLFKYRAGYRGDPNHLEIFQMIHKAFLEKGVNGIKELKYHSKDFQEALPDEKMRDFLEGLDGELGSKSAQAGKDIDIYKIVEGKLTDYEAHRREEKRDVLEQAREQTAELENKLRNTLQPFGESKESKPVAEKIAALLAKKDYKNLEKEKEALRGKPLIGKVERLRGAVVGQLEKLMPLFKETEKLHDTVEFGRTLTESFRELEGKPYEKQLELLEKIRQEHGNEKLENHAKTLNALGKQVYSDMGYFISQVLEPPRPAEENETVTTRITHDAQHLFTLGKFETNCQTPGVQHAHAVLGFTAHPNELTFGHFSNEGEYIGFTFAHVLQAKQGGLALVFDKIYSSKGHLRDAIHKTNTELGKKIEQLAQKRGLALKVYQRDNMPRKELTVLPTPYVRYKWYDIANDLRGAEVYGGETM